MSAVIGAVLFAGTVAAAPWSSVARAGSAVTPVVSVPGNGTGYRPPANARSLPGGVPHPGPAILFRPLATTPQFENTGPWRAAPIMVSGARAYRKGEYLYQDWLYDDTALTYPTSPAVYNGNAADIVEVRLKLLHDALAIRVVYNTMLDAHVNATMVSLGDSALPRAIPHNAGATSRSKVFVTAHGTSGDIVRAADGAVIGTARVRTDLARRQVEIDVPYTAFDPRGHSEPVGLAAGLWDARARAYIRPNTAKPAFFNVAFRRYPNPIPLKSWLDESQNAALSSGDISTLRDVIDFTKLASGVDDESRVPRTGAIDRIMVSHFEDAQGRGNDTAGGSSTGTPACNRPCTYYLSGRLQPYLVYVPDMPPPAAGFGLVINLHGASSNYNWYENGGPGPLMWKLHAEAGYPSIMVVPEARGPSYFYYGEAGADVFEVWADAAGHYALDPRHTVLTGSSMGGWGSYKLGAQWPDLWQALFPNVGPGAPTAADIPQESELVVGSQNEVWRMFGSLRNVPVLATQCANDAVVPIASTMNNERTLDGLSYRYDYWWFDGENGLACHAEYRNLVLDDFRALTYGLGPTNRNPRRVTYVVNPSMSEAHAGLDADHAYWVSQVIVRDTTQSPPLGTVDVISDAFPYGEPPALPQQQSVDANHNGYPLPDLHLSRGWGRAPAVAPRDELEITATNVRELTIDASRARVSCHPTWAVKSDGPIIINLAGCPSSSTYSSPGSASTRVGPP